MLVDPQVEVDKISGQLGPPPSLLHSGFPSAGRIGESLTDASRYHTELVSLHLRPAGEGQAFLVAQAGWGADAAAAAQAAYGEIARVLQDQGLTIVHERLFGSLKAKPAIMSARDAAFRASNLPGDGPFTYIQGQPPWGEGLAGVIIRAVSCRHPNDEVWTIREQGRAVGRGWRRQGAHFPLVAKYSRIGAGPHKVSNTRPHPDSTHDPAGRPTSRKPGGLLPGRGAHLVLP